MGSGLVKQKVGNALERITGLEETIGGLIQAVNQSLGQVDQNFGELAEKLDAVILLVGPDSVQEKVLEIRQRKLELRAEGARKALESAVEQGLVTPSNVIGDKTIIVARETDKDGNELPPGRVQVYFSTLKPEIQEDLRGKGAGYSFVTPSGGKFEVVSLFDSVENPVTVASGNSVPDSNQEQK